MYDLSIIAGDEKDMKSAQKRSITRVIIGVCIYFLPMIVNTILQLAGIGSGTCGL